MSLKSFPVLCSFLSACFSDTDPDSDQESARSFAARASRERRAEVLDQLRRFLDRGDFSLEDLGTEANRWFADVREAQSWLRLIFEALESEPKSGSPVVKDSNGAPLLEGDSVLVIKDLKVKGGSSDLKRGTLIKKIHLIEDVEAIECRVDGSTLVLKTCFLKKS
jgi:protein PhnA